MPITDFPVAGGDEPVSLKNTQYKLWTDLGYAEDLRQNWPQIWDRGGNILGNLQYRRLLPIVGRDSGNPTSDTEEKAIRLREAWAARHYGNTGLAGVVAQIKWFVAGRRGIAFMKQVIEAEKKRLQEKGMKKREMDMEMGGLMGTVHEAVKRIMNASTPEQIVGQFILGASEVAALDPENEALVALVTDLDALAEKLGAEDEPAAEEEPVEPGTEPDMPAEESMSEGKGWMSAWDRPTGPRLALREGDVAMRQASFHAGLLEVGAKKMMVATSSDVDRYGDIVDITSINLKEWKRNPVLLYGHDPSDPMNLIGQATNVEIKSVKGSDGKVREAVVYEPEFDLGGEPGVDDNPRAKLVARLYREGKLKTCSIGFIPDWKQTVYRSSLAQDDPLWAERGILFKGATVIECSILPIPANPNAETV